MIPHLSLLSVKLENYKDNNDDGNYDDIPDHNYCVEDRSITVMGVGAGDLPTHNRVSNGWILEGVQCSTQDNSD